MTSKVRKVLDWRLPFCAALMGLVLYIIMTGLSDARESREKSVRIDALIVEIQHQRETAADERAMASAERAKLLDGQIRLERQYQRLARQQAALLAYLRAQGIVVPEEFTTVYRITPRITSTPHKTTKPPAANKPPKAAGRSPHKHTKKHHRTRY